MSIGGDGFWPVQQLGSFFLKKKNRKRPENVCVCVRRLLLNETWLSWLHSMHQAVKIEAVYSIGENELYISRGIFVDLETQKSAENRTRKKG